MFFSFHSLLLPSAGRLHSQTMKLWLFILLAIPLSIDGLRECYILNADLTSASQLDGCQTLSNSLILTFNNNFTGTTNAVITRADSFIYIVGTNIEDISFLQLTERGSGWNKGNVITIENNPNLCTSDFEKMIEKLDPKPVYTIINNKDKTVCENERKQKELELERKQKEQELLEASQTTTAGVDNSAYQNIFAALCLVAAATIFAVM